MAILIGAISFWFGLLASWCLSAFAKIIRWSEPIHALAKSFDRRLPKGLEPLPPWRRLSERAVVILGQNPSSHHLQGTNTYLIGTGQDRILVDAGEGFDEYDRLLETVMKEVGCLKISVLLLTHWHIDHVGGVKKLLARFPELKIYKRRNKHKEVFQYNSIDEGQKFTTEGATLTAMYTPGHTEDHCSFVLEEDKALVCGDMILGCGTAVFDDLYDYMGSLERASAAVAAGGLTSLYVGHGPAVGAAAPPDGHRCPGDAQGAAGPLPAGAQERIEWYLGHRRGREAQLRAALRRRRARGEGLATSWALTREVYGHLPVFVFPSAHYNIEHHLDKLWREGEIIRGWRYAWRINPSIMDKKKV